MGISTDAILFYGYCWDEETNLFGEGEERYQEWEHIILKKRGFSSPWDSYPVKDAAIKKWKEDNKTATDEWNRWKNNLKEEFGGVDIYHHCSAEYTIPYITASRIEAHRGYPKEITPHLLGRIVGWDDSLDKFLDALDIPKPHSVPKWWLVSYWG